MLPHAHRLLALPLSALLALTACAKQDHAERAPADAPLAERLAHADARRGARLFGPCAACHNLSKGGGDRDGPNLWGVVGRPPATSSARFAYTDALKNKGGVWTCARLDAWIADPMRFAPGTMMLFAGIADGADRADIIAHLARSGDAAPPPDCAALPRSGTKRNGKRP